MAFVTASLLAISSLTSSVLAQDPSIQSSDAFVLYPIITSGELSGPYSNSNVNKSLWLNPQSYGSDDPCFNHFIFTDYIPTHCYAGQDQCGATRWYLNETYPNKGDDGVSISTYEVNLASIQISSASDTDDEGRRTVGWAASSCSSIPHPPGFSIQATSEGILNLEYENQDVVDEVFGSFFACWVDGDIYGPRMFYRDAEETLPEDCADLLLVPRCVNETSLVSEPVAGKCYQGGLPA